MQAENIPDELKAIPQWICWEKIPNKEKGRVEKIPKQVKSHKNASTTDPETWSKFSETYDFYMDDHYHGVGFVFSKEDPYCGIDLDDCRDPDTGQIQPWAIEILKTLGSYSEVSQSGKGIHIIIKAKLPGAGTKKLLPGTNHEVEIYDWGRYFATTGNRLPEYPEDVRECQEATLKLYRTLNPPAAQKEAKKTAQPTSPQMPDEEIIRRASEAGNGEKFKQLMDGDFSDYPSESEADGGLAALIGFWTQDFDQILRIIQQSELWDDKWEKREDYQQSTINGALATRTTFWTPGKNTQSKAATEAQSEPTEPEDSTDYREAVITIKRETKGEAGVRKEQISQLILNCLNQQGEFIKTHNTLYYFHKEGRRVMALTSMDFTAMLNERFGIVETETDFKYVVADLSAKCHNRGREAEVYMYAHYDVNTHRLYVDRFDGYMYRLDGETIELIANGADSVIFRRKPGYEPYTISEPDEGSDQLHDHVIKWINFDLDDTPLTAEDYQQLIRIWIHAIFFEELAPTKPLLLFTGVKGSGKTVIARLIGRLLFGRRGFDVATVGEERDYVANITNNYLLCLDNADTYKAWLSERLATTATGGTHVFRRLYTTNEMDEYTSRCFVMLTSRTPKFKRDDVVERMLIIKTRAPDGDKYISEGSIFEELEKHRNAILSEVFATLSEYIQNIKSKPGQVYEGPFRMADFAEFGAKVLDDDNREWFFEILAKVTSAQTDFLLEDDPFVEILLLWTADNPNIWITANGLYTALGKLAEDRKLTFPYKNPLSVSSKLRHQKSSLEQVLSIQKQKMKGTGQQYSFELKK